MHRKRFIASASLVASFMLAAAAISNAFALYTKGASEVDFHIGEQPKAGYYLVGTGSFVSDSKTWQTTGGVQMYQQSGYKGVLTNVHLTAGDVFKITNGSDEWYGWDKNTAKDTDVTNFRTAYFDFLDSGTWKNYNGGDGDTTADGKHDYYTYESDCYMWNSYIWQEENTSVNRWNSHAEQPSTKLYRFANGRYISDGNTATKISFQGDGNYSKRGDQWFTSNGNIVVGTTGNYNIRVDNEGIIFLAQVS